MSIFNCNYFWIDPKGPFTSTQTTLTEIKTWQQPENLLGMASFGLASLDAKKTSLTGTSPTGTKCILYTAPGISDIMKHGVASPTSKNLCYSTIQLPANLKPGIHRILYGWPYELSIHGSGRYYNDVAYVKIEGPETNVKTQGNLGIGLTSFTQQQINMQYDYWHQSPFESKISRQQWLQAITPKGETGPVGSSARFALPPRCKYQLSVV
jgi:hypothetical protein